MSGERKRGRPSLWRIDAAGVAVCLLLTVVVYAMAVQPVLDQKTEVLAQRQKLEQQRQRANELTGTLAKIRRQLVKIERAAAESEVRLKPVGNLNEQLAALTDLADDAGLRVDGVQPGEPTHGRRYETVPIELTGNGSYGACAAFLHRLHRSLPDMGVAGFELSATPRSPEDPAEFRFELTWFAAPGMGRSDS